MCTRTAHLLTAWDRQNSGINFKFLSAPDRCLYPRQSNPCDNGLIVANRGLPTTSPRGCGVLSMLYRRHPSYHEVTSESSSSRYLLLCERVPQPREYHNLGHIGDGKWSRVGERTHCGRLDVHFTNAHSLCVHSTIAHDSDVIPTNLNYNYTGMGLGSRLATRSGAGFRSRCRARA